MWRKSSHPFEEDWWNMGPRELFDQVNQKPTRKVVRDEERDFFDQRSDYFDEVSLYHLGGTSFGQCWQLFCFEHYVIGKFVGNTVIP